MTDSYDEDEFCVGPLPPVTLRLHGGLYDGVVWPWPGELDDAPVWIILGYGHLHAPTKEHVYRQLPSGINEDLLRAIVRYEHTGQSPGALIQNVTLENNECLRNTLDELQQKLTKRQRPKRSRRTK